MVSSLAGTCWSSRLWRSRPPGSRRGKCAGIGGGEPIPAFPDGDHHGSGEALLHGMDKTLAGERPEGNDCRQSLAEEWRADAVDCPYPAIFAAVRCQFAGL